MQSETEKIKELLSLFEYEKDTDTSDSRPIPDKDPSMAKLSSDFYRGIFSEKKVVDWLNSPLIEMH